MTETQQKTAAKEFAVYWKGKGYEKGESQSFWLSLLRDVYGVEHPEKFIIFEEQVHLDHTSFIDGNIPSTKVLIEQKGLGKDLKKPIKQSDGTLLTPFQQAKRYITELPLSQHPRWVVTCNFSTFFVYDMERPGGEPEEILLENLEKEYYRLQFLVDSGSEHLKREMEVSIAAGEIVGLLYDAFAKQYVNPNSEKALKSLNVLCVRFVFCMYAEDAGIFGHHGMFHDYLAGFETRQLRRAVIDLFHILDTPPEERDPYLKYDNPVLAAFPYVNGGLFANEDIEIPPFTEEIKDLLLNKASKDFDWSEISPTIFGAVFESTLNPETRRSGGMHYTSIENIHKVIDPLFMDSLKAEFSSICEITVLRTRERKLRNFQSKLASLSFLDPACGSGNFLTETYISLRRLENDVLRELLQGQVTLGDENYSPIQVSISNFYGIEINDFAVTVAKTALWIAESQMMKETETIVLMHLDFLPLKTNAGIVEGNALRMDWGGVIPKAKLSYIMGNPPFRGHRLRSREQATDMEIMSDVPKYGKIDYVGAWFYKAAHFIQETKIKTSFVSTNSICQGESVGTLWKYLVQNLNIEIQFAYRTFNWQSEASEQAAVHCVIIGFTAFKEKESKILFSKDTKKYVNHINAYLYEADDIFLASRGKCLTAGMPKLTKGNEATDGGFLSLTENEKNEIIKKYPRASNFIKKYVGAAEFINNKKRYCIWLKDVSPSEYRNIPPIMERIEKVRNFRANNVTKAVHKLADTPMLFAQIRQPDSDYLLLPTVSSQNRRYIPMGFMHSDTIANPKVLITVGGNLYLFGILESNVHMAWMRVVTGRLKSDYEYYPSVYNNFPFPTPTERQKKKIEQTAQGILDARALYPNDSLAALYDELTMPPELRTAHQNNDRAVMEAYGFKPKDPAYKSESACVAELMKLYQKLTEK